MIIVTHFKNYNKIENNSLNPNLRSLKKFNFSYQLSCQFMCQSKPMMETILKIILYNRFFYQVNN